ncbi:PHD finger-like domain-containing protein 5B [Glycine soja]
MCFDMDKNLLMCWAWTWTWAWAFFGSGLFSEVPFPSPLHSSPSLASFSFASTVTQPSLFRVLAQDCELWRLLTFCHCRAFIPSQPFSNSEVVENMAKHHPDLIMCRKQPGIAIGRLCEKCDGKCVICDSYVRPCTLVRVCDECNYGSFQGRCVICGGVGISDAYYCKECTQQEKDRDGCPKIVNLGSAKTDLFYERKKYGFKKR